MSPIEGISLELYAELGADVTGQENDPEACARIVQARGISRLAWEAAKAGFTARMQDISLMGRVAMAYMPLYQAALARKKGNVAVSFDDYVTMCGAAKAMGLDRMCATYNIQSSDWTQIAGAWNQEMGRDMMRYAGLGYGTRVEQEAMRLQQGGQALPVTIQRTAGQAGAAPAAAPQAQSAAGVAQQMQNQQMAYAVQNNVAAHMAAAQAQAAAAYGNAAQNMGALGRGMMGMMGMGAIASGVGPGMQALVTWSDGNKYPGTVMQVQNGQVLVAFANGQQMWVPEGAVSRQ